MRTGVGDADRNVLLERILISGLIMPMKSYLEMIVARHVHQSDSISAIAINMKT